MNPHSATAPAALPRGLREVGAGRYLIQVTRDGQKLTRRVAGTRAEAVRALERANLELGARLASLPAQAPSLPSLQSGPPLPPLPALPPPSSPTPSASAVPSQPAPVGSCATLAEFLAVGGRYENHQQRQQNFNTQRKLESVIRHLVASPLGELRLDAIRTADINSYVTWRMKTPLSFAVRKDGQPWARKPKAPSAATVNKSLQVLKSALRFAQEEGLVASVPTIRMQRASDAKRVRGPSRAQLAQLLEASRPLAVELSAHNPEAHWLPEVLVLLSEFGLRPAELFRLTWASVSFDHHGDGAGRGAIYVEEQTRLGFKPKNGKRRLIPMSALAREALQRLQARKPKPTPEDLVVPNRDGLPFIKLDTPEVKGGGTYLWKRLRALVPDAPASMYSLRHYFAEQRLAFDKVPLHVVSRWMGHSKVELTSKQYGDFAPDNLEQWTYLPTAN